MLRPKLPRGLQALAAWIVLSGSAVLAGTPPVHVDSAAPWIQPTDWVAASPTNSASSTSSGLYYLLYERQSNPIEGEQFYRIALHILNEAGVRSAGQLTVDFDPSFQQPVFHYITVHRNGESINQLRPETIRIIQPEPDLNRDLFTGEQQALAFLEDLRVGDILEYSYTLRGKNPLFETACSLIFTVQSGVPIDRQRFRILWPSSQPLFLRHHGTEVTPQQTLTNGFTEYQWDFGPLPAIQTEDLLPITYTPFPFIQASSFPDWAAAARWEIPLYETKESDLPEELLQQIARWNTATDPEEKALAALDFVQNEIRYTGLEFGINAFQPAHPVETFRRRYGDCKGKSALLCVILRKMGIPASPALVNTSLRHRIAEYLPTPLLFDHVIVKMMINGQAVWVDPSSAHQGGPLRRRTLPNYGLALVVSPDTDRLEQIPWAAPECNLSLEAHFELKDYTSPVLLRITTVSRDEAADDLRSWLARSSVEEIGRQYLNYYAKTYPSLRAVHPLQVEDHRQENRITQTECYEIAEFWSRNDEDSCFEAPFYAEIMNNLLPQPTTRLRSQPLSIPFPIHRQQTLFVHLPDNDWDLPADEVTINDPAFRFHFQQAFTNQTLTWAYTLQTLTPEIPPAALPSFLKNRSEMEKRSQRGLYRNNAAPQAVTPPPNVPAQKPFDLNWITLVIALGFSGFLLTVGIFLWIAGVDRPPLRPANPALNGLRGWLVLVGLGLGLSLLLRITQIPKLAPAWFSATVWQSATLPGGTSYHPITAPLLVFEVTANLLMLGMNLLCIALFFSKRREFRKTYFALLITSLAVITIDTFGAHFIPPNNSPISVKEILQAAIGTVLWGSYILVSQRARSTFIR